MMNVILVIHIIACVLLTGFVLIQKSEGGGLGMGGGGGGGGGNSLMSGRGAASAIMRMTLIVGGIFFATSLGLTAIVSRNMDTSQSVLDQADAPTEVDAPTDMMDLSTLIDETGTPEADTTEEVVSEDGGAVSDEASPSTTDAPATPEE